MPPLRRGGGVNRRSRDILSQVEDKLKLTVGIPESVLEATRSSLRVLKIRNPIGSFGKYDNETKRACALLEYDVREHQSCDNDTNIEIPMEKLAKAAFMKLKDFREFHEKIGNFRDNLRSSSRTSSKRDKPRQSDGTSVETNTGKGSTQGIPISLRKSSISSLAIQLGAFVPNSSDVGVRAQKLFNNVLDFFKQSSKKMGVHGLKDMERNQSTYEAACFYIVATSGIEVSTKKRRRPKGSKLYEEDGEDNQQLDLSTFLEVTKVPSQFHTICKYVKELQDRMESSTNSGDIKDTGSSSRSAMPAASSSRGVMREGKATMPTNSRKRLRTDEIIGTTKATVTEQSEKNEPTSNGLSSTFKLNVLISSNEETTVENTNDTRSYPERISRPNPIFEEWKSKVLADAMEAIHRSKSVSDEMKTNNCNNKIDLLDLATRKVLERHGFLE